MSSGLSWQSGRFQNQRSVVRIQSSVNFYNEHVYCCKEGNKDKEKRNGPFFKKSCPIFEKLSKSRQKSFYQKSDIFQDSIKYHKKCFGYFLSNFLLPTSKKSLNLVTLTHLRWDVFDASLEIVKNSCLFSLFKECNSRPLFVHFHSFQAFFTQ